MFFAYAPNAPGVCREGGFKVTFSATSFLLCYGLRPPPVAGKAGSSGQTYQLEVKSNLSPVSRMFCAVRQTKKTVNATPRTNMMARMTRPSAGTAWTTSIHTATKATAAKLIGTRYFQHMFII